MHDGMVRLREQSRRTATQHLGVPATDRVYTDQVRQTGAEAEFLRLPVVPPHGDVNPASVFVVGISPIGGGDPVA